MDPLGQLVHCRQLKSLQIVLESDENCNIIMPNGDILHPLSRAHDCLPPRKSMSDLRLGFHMHAYTGGSLLLFRPEMYGACLCSLLQQFQSVSSLPVETMAQDHDWSYNRHVSIMSVLCTELQGPLKLPAAVMNLLILCWFCPV